MKAQKSLPKIVVKSIGFGLLLMALFTMMWAGIASSGIIAPWSVLILFVFGALSVCFIAYAVYLFKAARNISDYKTEEDIAESKRIGIWYAIIFGGEGVIIPVVCGALAYFNQVALMVPAIALVVGLHFYPMAKVFRRTLDYYLATWTVLVAIAAIIYTVKNLAPQATIFCFLGIGVALATSAYGVYMIWFGRNIIKAGAVAKVD